ncbi:MAG: hypothetical protein COB45_09180 [Gammaproteobacteria bacterium]|nr:MAG: hypothetical protein COB45_09180 [Gammaproteobacteria bacterium]
MNEEKIVYILDLKNLLSEFLAFLFFIEKSVFVSMTVLATSLTLVHSPNILPLQFMVLISDKKQSKNNLEVKL